jgi:DNA-binding transcriptional ArsR family regulator
MTITGIQLNNLPLLRDTFSILSNGSANQVLHFIAGSPGLINRNIAKEVNISEQLCKYYLKKLVKCDLLEKSEGKYYANTDVLRAVTRIATDLSKDELSFNEANKIVVSLLNADRIQDLKKIGSVKWCNLSELPGLGCTKNKRLKILLESGIIEEMREGKKKRLKLNKDKLRILASFRI